MTRVKSEEDGRGSADRREVIAKFLGVGGAVALLGGCVSGGNEPEVGVANAALSGSSVWFDTITGPGGLRSYRPPVTPTPYGQTVMVGGHSVIDDGGGGAFVWATDTPVFDDNGMVIVPPGGAGLAAGCWRRAYSGAINVRWFGARGNGNTLTDGAAIQAAINAAASRGGGVVFVPAGDYCVSATIYLPKRYGDQPVPIALVGEGAALSSTPLTGRRNGSCLRWTSMSSTGALLAYASDTADTYFHAIENLLFVSGDGYGAVTLFAHDSGGAQGVNGVPRWRSGVIRNCLFASKDLAGVVLVKLEGMWNSVLDNVILDGGDVGVHAVSGSRLELANVQTLSKQRGPSRAILIEGGNAHVLRHCRFEGSPPTNPSNVHITLTGGTSDIAIDAASAEGATELLHLDIDDASMVRVTNPNLGPIRVGRRASRVEILGGSVGGLPPSAILPARPAIHVEAGARHVRVAGVTSTNAASQIVIDDDAGSPTMTKNVVIEVLDSSVPNLYPMRFTKGMFDTTYVDNQTLHLQPWVDRAGVDLYVVAQPPSYDYLRGISPGQDGQVITLLLTGTTTNFIGNATNLPADAAPLFVQSEACLPQNSTIRFLYRAGAWYELGRSTNNGGTGVLHGC